MSNIDKKIAEAIVYAQIASDAGKGIKILKTNKIGKSQSTVDKGYNSKDGYIFSALNLIRNTKNCGYKYYVTAQPDQNGNPSFIIYFNFKVNGKREQVSFHSFNKKLWKGLVGSGTVCHWQGGIGGSRKACKKLIGLYDL